MADRKQWGDLPGMEWSPFFRKPSGLGLKAWEFGDTQCPFLLPEVLSCAVPLEQKAPQTATDLAMSLQ